MTHTIIEKDGRPAVSHTFRVRYAETDAMAVAHHSSYILWMEMGRTEFMRAHGFTYRELEATGVLMPILEIGVKYRNSAIYDDELRITTWIGELTRVRVKLHYLIERVEDNKVLAEAFTLQTFIGPGGSPIRITHHPEAWNWLLKMAPDSGVALRA